MRVVWIDLLSFSVVFPLSVSGCAAQECVSNGERPGVLLIDARTQLPVCGAMVSLREGDYEETAITAASDASCTGIHRFSGREGSYLATVTAPSYIQAEAPITFRKLECTYDVQGEGPRNGLPGFAYLVTVSLTPDGG